MLREHKRELGVYLKRVCSSSLSSRQCRWVFVEVIPSKRQNSSLYLNYKFDFSSSKATKCPKDFCRFTCTRNVLSKRQKCAIYYFSRVSMVPEYCRLFFTFFKTLTLTQKVIQSVKINPCVPHGTQGFVFHSWTWNTVSRTSSSVIPPK